MGLGHLRRAHNIGREILSREPQCNILVLADSPSPPFCSPVDGFDYLKLPTIVKTGSMDWRTGMLHVGLDEAVNLRAKLILQAYDEFRPDVVLIDHMPVGALQELRPMLDSATSAARGPELFLGIRDVLDAPEVIRHVWAELGAYEELWRYRAVLVYGCREIYDADAAYDLSAHARRVVYCNYATSRGRVRPPPDPADEPLILVMGGGGADAFPLASAFLEAIRILPERVQAVLLTGPNMPSSDREAIYAQAASSPVRVEAGFQDVTAWIERASVVVTMAGYNSLCEVMRLQRKALVVPRAGPSAEQRIRGRLFSERRLVRLLDPVDLDPERLAAELGRLLGDEAIPNLANIPPLDGAQRAADLLLNDPTPVPGEPVDDLTDAHPRSRPEAGALIE